MNLQGEELEEFLKTSAKGFQEDTEFLIQRGWTQTEKKELNGEGVFSVWVSPDGEEYGHQNSMFGGTKWKSAIDHANSAYIKELGFESFCLSSTCPELDEDYNRRRAVHFHKDDLGDEIWDKWGMFIHPISRRVYTYMEALHMARHGNMKDLDLTTQCCGKTQDIQKIIDEQKIEPKLEMNLFVEFLKGNQETHFYRFHSIKFS